MLVFYSGWGYWVYESEDFGQQLASSHVHRVCGLFELPKNAEKEVTYQGHTIINYLLPSIYSDLEEPIKIHNSPVLGDVPKFFLCDEQYQYNDFTNGHVELKPVKYTRADIVEKVIGDDVSKPKILTETERNTMLKLIIGMAIAAYKYDPQAQRNPATGDNKGSIKASLDRYGITIDSDTIRKYLNEAKELIDAKPK